MYLSSERCALLIAVLVLRKVSVVDMSLDEASLVAVVRAACESSGFFYRASFPGTRPFLTQK